MKFVFGHILFFVDFETRFQAVNLAEPILLMMGHINRN